MHLLLIFKQEAGVFPGSFFAYATLFFISNLAFKGFGSATRKFNKVHICSSCLQKTVVFTFYLTMLCHFIIFCCAYYCKSLTGL